MFWALAARFAAISASTSGLRMHLMLQKPLRLRRYRKKRRLRQVHLHLNPRPLHKSQLHPKKLKRPLSQHRPSIHLKTRVNRQMSLAKRVISILLLVMTTKKARQRIQRTVPVTKLATKPVTKLGELMTTKNQIRIKVRKAAVWLRPWRRCARKLKTKI